MQKTTNEHDKVTPKRLQKHKFWFRGRTPVEERDCLIRPLGFYRDSHPSCQCLEEQAAALARGQTPVVIGSSLFIPADSESLTENRSFFPFDAYDSSDTRSDSPSPAPKRTRDVWAEAGEASEPAKAKVDAAKERETRDPFWVSPTPVSSEPVSLAFSREAEKPLREYQFSDDDPIVLTGNSEASEKGKGKSMMNESKVPPTGDTTEDDTEDDIEDDTEEEEECYRVRPLGKPRCAVSNPDANAMRAAALGLRIRNY
ncbi:MAG: hypothetical protein Q9157_008782 [Trypethelium eluteriae]